MIISYPMYVRIRFFLRIFYTSSTSFHFMFLHFICYVCFKFKGFSCCSIRVIFSISNFKSKLFTNYVKRSKIFLCSIDLKSPILCIIYCCGCFYMEGSKSCLRKKNLRTIYLAICEHFATKGAYLFLYK